MALEKKDFVEINFTGKTKEGEIFDSNIQEDLQKAGLQEKVQAKPFIFSLGEGMFLKGIDDYLIGKEPGKYSVELTPDNAFGLRDPKMIQVTSLKMFKDNELNPVPGSIFNFDGRMGRILSVSGGRVSIDFNHPLAGKTVIYDLEVLRKVEDLSEKVKAFVNFLFKRDLNFELKEKKIFLEIEKNFTEFAQLFKDKFNEIFGLELEIKERIEDIGKEISEAGEIAESLEKSEETD